MQQKISVVNESTGKFTTETINGREHIVTSMMAIEGDSVMNGLFYPNNVVMASLYQLDMKPAPDMHPDVDGNPVSAFNPLAMNAHNFGGFTRSPRKDGKQVITDLVIDVEVANRTTRGKKIINKVKAGQPIGVSTGLLAEVTNASGKVGDQEFEGKVDLIEFDHVAVLLDAQPAGLNTYTINHGVINLKPKPRGIYMDELKLDLTSLAIADRIKLGNLKVNELLDHVNHKTTLNEARAVVNSAGLHIHEVPETDVAVFLENREQFDAFIATAETGLQEKRDFIVANSKMTAEQVAGMDSEQLDSLAASVAPKNKFINTKGGKRTENTLELLDDETLAVGE